MSSAGIKKQRNAQPLSTHLIEQIGHQRSGCTLIPWWAMIEIFKWRKFSLFFVRPYTCMCFSNIASDIFMVLSFLFLGLFHWQMYDVTGRASSSSRAPSGPGERKGDMVPPRHAGEPKHVCERPISCVKRRKSYLFSQLTQYCILYMQTCWGAVYK